MELDTLDLSVKKALDFFTKHKPPRFEADKLNWPLVIGSGNAYNTGAILFSGKPAILANESNLKEIIKGYGQLIKRKMMDTAVIISASGEKDSVWETELCRKNKLKTILLTCSADSSAAKLADHTLAFRKLPEPYTYNVSTYLGMMLGAENGNAKEIATWIKKQRLPKDFFKYKSFTFLLPDRFEAICPMLDIKRNELFGNHLSLRAFSHGQARHAKFVHPDKGEMVISIGENKLFGDNRWQVAEPKNLGFAGVMAMTYYITGLIQKNRTPWFKRNIKLYCLERGPKAYGQTKPFEVIVPGN